MQLNIQDSHFANFVISIVKDGLVTSINSVLIKLLRLDYAKMTVIRCYRLFRFSWERIQLSRNEFNLIKFNYLLSVN